MREKAAIKLLESFEFIHEKVYPELSFKDFLTKHVSKDLIDFLTQEGSLIL